MNRQKLRAVINLINCTEARDCGRGALTFLGKLRVTSKTDHAVAALFIRNTATMSLTNCRFYEEKYPDVDSLVMVNVRQVAEMGA